MEDITIEALIAQRRVVTTADLLTPTNDYMVVGVYQNGTSKSRGDGTSYKNYVISIAELLGGGAAYTASNGISLVGLDFQLTSQNISQFVNNSGYLTAATVGNVAWKLDGNTVGSEKFLGTIDNFALPFRVNNNEVMRITNDAAGSTRFYFNQTTNLHGSNSGIQYSSDGTSPNRSQIRFNLYGANTGAPGVTGFKSRGATIGSTLSVLPGDNLFRITSIGVSGNDTSINLASLIDVRVNQVFVGHVSTDFVVALNSNAGVMTERLYVTSEGNVGIGTVVPTATIHGVGSDTTSGNFALKLENSLLAELFYVRNDGAVSSRNGYWQNGFKVIDILTATINTTVWSGNFPTVGGSRNTLIGGNDTGTAIVSGSYNSVFGDFTTVGDISGSRNLIWGNGSGSGITSGNSNILFGGSSNAGTLNAQIGFNAICSAANEVVFGNKDLAIYDSFVYGVGQYSTTAYGTGRTLTFGPTTREVTGDVDGPAIYRTWRFRGSQGTGTEHGGDIVFAVAPGGITGTAVNPLVDKLTIKGNGNINMASLPVSAVGLVAGDIWNNAGVLTIV